MWPSSDSSMNPSVNPAYRSIDAWATSSRIGSPGRLLARASRSSSLSEGPVARTRALGVQAQRSDRTSRSDRHRGIRHPFEDLEDLLPIFQESGWRASGFPSVRWTGSHLIVLGVLYCAQCAPLWR